MLNTHYTKHKLLYICIDLSTKGILLSYSLYDCYKMGSTTKYFYKKFT